MQIRPEDVATVAFATAAERDSMCGASGWYIPDQNTVRVLPGFKEFSVWDILAHEYAHNWQSRICEDCSPARREIYNGENVEDPLNIPFLGQLFIEGGAVWVQAHVSDYFANRMVLSEDSLASEHSTLFGLKSAHYWQGFRMLKFLEEECGGIRPVVQLMVGGDIAEATQGTYKDYWDLYRDCGLIGFLQDQGKFASDQGWVPLFQVLSAKGLLAERINLVRISAWVIDVPWIPPGIPPRSKDRRGNPDSDESYLGRLNEFINRRALQIEWLLHTFPEADGILSQNQLEDHVENPKARNISLWTACHLKSTALNPTSGMLEPILEWIANRLAQYVNDNPAPPPAQIPP